jgi:hypothetical protein
MTNRKGPFIPPKLVALDLVGMVLLGIGLSKYLGGVEIVPLAFQFQDYTPFLIGGGIGLMAPLQISLFRRIKERSTAK